MGSYALSMNLTYRQLLERLQALPPERLEDNVTIAVLGDDDAHPASDTGIVTDGSDLDGVLDVGHFYIVI